MAVHHRLDAGAPHFLRAQRSAHDLQAVPRLMLEVLQVNKRFGTVIAAEDLNVSVSPGEIVGIVGANGAGKTVFVNMITGYEKPSSGKIVFEGGDITALAP